MPVLGRFCRRSSRIKCCRSLIRWRSNGLIIYLEFNNFDRIASMSFYFFRNFYLDFYPFLAPLSLLSIAILITNN